ncbi:MAG: hypothetical protein DVS81_14555 [Candidatus Accumulibacter meliphilus]|uniref:Uncharacterized protein n=1 Tax=Candidatus Accumulibacter meliphilus TaxID=2211374 RepID=A0A369XIX3_9PROT|nr:MAG: hypothetical protein DVS81_14555 [Candidatus Accumulibacter meliphilus]
MLDRGYLGDFTGGVRQAKQRAEELIRRFMRGFLEVGSPSPALLRSPLYRSGARVMDEHALLVWRVAVLKKARRQKLVTRYRKDVVTEECLRDLAKLSRFEQGPALAVEFLANIGIVLVIEEHFKKTYLDAALKHDPAESGPFAGNARFCGRGGQIVVGWRQRTGGMESVRRMSKGFLDGGTIARRAFPDAAYAALERMFR